MIDYKVMISNTYTNQNCDKFGIGIQPNQMWSASCSAWWTLGLVTVSIFISNPTIYDVGIPFHKLAVQCCLLSNPVHVFQGDQRCCNCFWLPVFRCRCSSTLIIVSHLLKSLSSSEQQFSYKLHGWKCVFIFYQLHRLTAPLYTIYQII